MRQNERVALLIDELGGILQNHQLDVVSISVDAHAAADLRTIKAPLAHRAIRRW
jgi:hypothetical protein